MSPTNPNVVDDAKDEKQNLEMIQPVDGSIPQEPTNLPSGPLVGRRLIFVFVGLAMTLFLAALDGTIVATAMPSIASDFNAFGSVSWVATSYFLTFTAFQPVFSKISDIFGRKYIAILGIIIFLTGSAVCGAAQDIIMLVIFRAVTGIGGSAIFSMVMVLIADIIPLRSRGKYTGIINAVFAIASVIGPLLGGVITQYVTWRWIFYVNLPIGFVAGAVTWIWLPSNVGLQERKAGEDTSMRARLNRIDFRGAALIVLISTLLLLGLQWGGSAYPWVSAPVLICLILGVALFYPLFIVEQRAVEPLIPFRLFRNRSYAAVLASSIFYGMSFFAEVYYFPIWFQVVRGDSPSLSGIKMLPLQLATPVVATGIGFVISATNRVKPMVVLGALIMCAGVGLLALWSPLGSQSIEYAIEALIGISCGLIFSSYILAAQSSVDTSDMAVATGLYSFSRQFGGSIGTAVCSAILFSYVSEELPKVLPANLAASVISSSDNIRTGLLTPAQQTIAINTYAQGLHNIFWTLLPISILSLLASLFVGNHKLEHKQKKPTVDDLEKQKA